MSRYQVIYTDPAWEHDHQTKHGGTDNHYETFKVHEDEEIKTLVNDWADENCMLLMWGTWPKLREAMLLGDFWGFRYVTCAFVWVKTNLDPNQGFLCLPQNMEAFTFFGIGYHSASNTEFCLLWKRGQLEWKDNTIRQLVFDQRREHSRKPDKVRDLISRAYPEAKKIEMFSRRPATPEWSVWGNETEKFDNE